jgi:hypothetical protein
MIAIGRRAIGEQRRRPLESPEGTYYKAEWMESGDDPAMSPTIFLIEQPPHATLFAHFHRQNQFQLFVDGSGKIGPRALGPVVVHYAGAFKAYGPIVAGAKGLKYFTIRTVLESGLFSVSENAADMKGRPKRHATSKPIEAWPVEKLRALEATETQAVLPITQLQLGAGQFLVVLGGSVIHEGEQLERWESLFVPLGDPYPSLVAGDDGAEIVSMFSPANDSAYQ